jgi:hypothetical protein
MLLLRTLHCNNSKKIRFIAESLELEGVTHIYIYTQVESGPKELIFIYVGSAVAAVQRNSCHTAGVLNTGDAGGCGGN